MEKSFMRVKVKNSLLIVFVSVLFLSACATHVSAQPATMVAVNPPTVTINEVGGTDSVTVNVTGVADLYTWQIRLYFDNETVNFAAASLPSGHIFDGKSVIPVTPVLGADENGTYVEYGCSLVDITETFTGDGTLCEISFTGIALGSSPLKFGRIIEYLGSLVIRCDFTYLLDSNAQFMDFDMTHGRIDVVPEFSTFAMMLLLIMLTLVATIIAKKNGQISASLRKKNGE